PRFPGYGLEAAFVFPALPALGVTRVRSTWRRSPAHAASAIRTRGAVRRIMTVQYAVYLPPNGVLSAPTQTAASSSASVGPWNACRARHRVRRARQAGTGSRVHRCRG